MLVHNQTTMNTGFEFEILEGELESIDNIDMSLFGFEIAEPLEYANEGGTLEYNEESSKKEILCPRCGMRFIP